MEKHGKVIFSFHCYTFLLVLTIESPNPQKSLPSEEDTANRSTSNLNEKRGGRGPRSADAMTRGEPEVLTLTADADDGSCFLCLPEDLCKLK